MEDLSAAGATEPLLRRKIAVPSVPGLVMPRPRLFRELSRAIDHPATTVLAPAGWGKTLLLCSWLDLTTPTGSVSWLSLSPDDNDPARFWSYVLAALRAGNGDSRGQALSQLRAPDTSGQNRDRFLAMLVNALAELDRPALLVLDDIHEVQSPDVTQGIAFLLAHAPSQLRLLLSGRFLPSIPMGRMRLAGEVTEIGASELAFTVDEVAELFSGSEVRLTRSEIAVLHERTEGWPAGIRLAALSLRDATNGKAAIAEFAGNQRTVSEYLMGEVFNQQDASTRDFLLRTGICDLLTDELATALTGRTDASMLLEDMERRNVFVVAQGRRPWYRYHQLFAEMLRHKLKQQSTTQETARLHEIAATWYEANELRLEAVQHAILAGKWDLVTSVITEAGLTLLLDGELATMHRLLEQIPNTVVLETPELCALRSATRFASGELLPAEADLRAAELMRERVPETRRRVFEQVIALIRVDQAQLDGDVDAARRAVDLLLSVARSGGISASIDEQLLALAQLHLGVTTYFTGPREEAERILRESLATARRSGRDYIVLGSLSQLAVVLTAQNRATEAARLAGEAVALAERRGWGLTTQMAETWHALGWIHYVWNELDAADRYLAQAEESVREGDTSTRGAIRIVRGLVLSLRGNDSAALATLEAAGEDLRPMSDRYVSASYLDAEQARLAIALGDYERARELIAKLSGDASVEWPIHLLVARAELQLAEGDPRGAGETLAPAIAGTASGSLRLRLLAVVLSAVALDQQGEETQAWDRLEFALDLAEPENFRQPFLSVGTSARRLLSRHNVRRSRHRGFVEALLASFHAAPTTRAADALQTEILTERELDVLHYLPTLLTVPEIATELFVSVNTVKAHMRHIYRKLGASSRRKAVARATELGLIH